MSDTCTKKKRESDFVDKRDLQRYNAEHLTDCRLTFDQ